MKNFQPGLWHLRIVIQQRTCITLAAIGVIFIGTTTPVSAATNTSWQQSVPLRSPLSGHVLYGTLSQTGSSAFYTFTITRPGSITVSLSVPTWADQDFMPQLVLYEPDSITVGPVLPMAQPPETIASIFPSDSGSLFFDQSSLTVRRQVQETTLVMAKPGRYFLAVYNAGTAAGRWRLAFNGPPKVVDIFRWPGQCWQDNAWTGWTLQTLFIPLLVLALSAAVISRIKVKPKAKPRKRSR